MTNTEIGMLLGSPMFILLMGYVIDKSVGNTGNTKPSLILATIITLALWGIYYIIKRSSQ
jgi:hypothetical protein